GAGGERGHNVRHLWRQGLGRSRRGRKHECNTRQDRTGAAPDDGSCRHELASRCALHTSPSFRARCRPRQNLSPTGPLLLVPPPHGGHMTPITESGKICLILHGFDDRRRAFFKGAHAPRALGNDRLYDTPIERMQNSRRTAKSIKEVMASMSVGWNLVIRLSA